MQHLNRFTVSPSIEQKFGRLLESEDDETQEKDEYANATNAEKCVPPSHIGSFCATRGSRSDAATGWKGVSICIVST